MKMMYANFFMPQISKDIWLELFLSGKYISLCKK